MRKVTAVLGAASCLSIAAYSVAAGAGAKPQAIPRAASYGVDIQATFDTTGNPELVANFSPDGGLAKPRWSICSPPDVTRCTPTDRRGWLRPGTAPAGTVFEATAGYGGQQYVARTEPWGGTVHATALPRLEGRPVVGAIVKPVAGEWTGGWTDGFDRLRVQACRTIDAKGCVTLSAEGEEYRGRHRSALIRSRYVGWYLFAFDSRFAHDALFAGVGYGHAVDVPPLKAGPTVARSAPLGPVRTR